MHFRLPTALSMALGSGSWRGSVASDAHLGLSAISVSNYAPPGDCPSKVQVRALSRPMERLRVSGVSGNHAQQNL